MIKIEHGAADLRIERHLNWEKKVVIAKDFEPEVLAEVAYHTRGGQFMKGSRDLHVRERASWAVFGPGKPRIRAYKPLKHTVLSQSKVPYQNPALLKCASRRQIVRNFLPAGSATRSARPASARVPVSFCRAGCVSPWTEPGTPL